MPHWFLMLRKSYHPFREYLPERRRKPRRWETFGQNGVRGQETRAQLASFASSNGIALNHDCPAIGYWSLISQAVSH